MHLCLSVRPSVQPVAFSLAGFPFQARDDRHRPAGGPEEGRRAGGRKELGQGALLFR